MTTREVAGAAGRRVRGGARVCRRGAGKISRCFEEPLRRRHRPALPAAVRHQGLLCGAVRAHGLDEADVQGGREPRGRLLELIF